MQLDQLPTTNELPADQPEWRLISELASALHAYGAPAHELEESMSETAQRLGVIANFFVTPTSIFIAFEKDERQQTTLARVEPGEMNLGKLSELWDLQARLLSGSISPEDSIRELRELRNAAPSYGVVTTVGAFALIPTTAAVFFGGGFREILMGGVSGFLVGLVIALAGGVPRLRRILLPAASWVAAAVNLIAAALWLPGLSTEISTICAIIVLVPGFTLTIAMNELASQNLVSGAARMSGAFAQLLMIGFGVALGQTVTTMVGAAPAPSVEPLPAWASWLAMVPAGCGFAVVFQARLRDAGWIILACMIAFGGAQLGNLLLGQSLGVAVAAFVLGIASNAFSRLLHRPASVTLAPGLLLLVPGSLGYRSIAQLTQHETMQGVETAFLMGLAAVSIAAGLLLANIFLPTQPNASAVA